MVPLEDAQKMIGKIVSATGKSRAEIEKLIEDKRQKFAGLLTDSGAAFMVAKELNVDLNLESKVSEFLKISQLEEGMNNIDLLVRVKQVFAPRKFEKGNKKGVLCNIIVADDSGETRLTLWHKDVKKLEEEKVERGSVLLLKNCYITSFGGKPQINLSFNGSFEVNPKNVEVSSLPKFEGTTLKLNELREGMNDVNIVVRILRIYGVSTFSKEGTEGKLVNFEIADKTKKMRATAWNDLALKVNQLQEGSLVKIEGAYTKQGLKELELHLGWTARVIVEPLGSFEVPELNELLNDVEEKKVSELKEGDKFVEVSGKVVEVVDGNLFFNVCPKCNSKVQVLEEKFVCEKCGEVKAKKNLVIAVRLDDASDQINVVFFGREAEKLVEFDVKELERRLKEKEVREILEDLRKELVGKKLKASGFVRKSKFSEEIELVGKRVEVE